MLTEDGDGLGRPGASSRSTPAPIKDTYVLDYDWDVTRTAPASCRWGWSRATCSRRWTASYTLPPRATATEVTYRLAVDVKIPMLGMLKRKAEKVIIDTALKELKKRVEG